ncbi:MAG: hypothetical protein AB2A00_35420 [Myxococcota bacterium]
MRIPVLVAALSLALPLLTAGADVAHAKEKKAAPAKKEGMITWKVAPESVVIFVDGKKVGTAGTAKPHKVKPGQHLIKLVWGKDEAEEPIDVPAGQSVEFQYTFEDSGKPQPAE